jgi:hypothetical protein
MIKALHGDCISKIHGYWEYRVCFGDKIRQFHANDEYILGKYNSQRDTTDSQIFDDGQKCEPKETRRSTTLRYMCGNTKEIVSIIEPKECTYEMVVTHPSLCGTGSPFQIFSGQQVSSELKSPDDHWFMSLEKSVAGHYVCQAYCILRDVKEKPSVCFSKFAMQVSDDKRGVIGVKQAVSRHFARVPFAKNEVDVVKAGDHSYAVVSTQQFSGSLEFSKVIFVDE